MTKMSSWYFSVENNMTGYGQWVGSKTYLHPDQVGGSRSSQQYLRSSIQRHKILLIHGACTQRGIPFWNQSMCFLWDTRKHEYIRVTCVQWETRKLKGWMSLCCLINIIFSVMDPKTIGLTSHSTERNTSIPKHQWWTNRTVDVVLVQLMR